MALKKTSGVKKSKYAPFCVDYTGTSLNEPPVGVVFGKTGHGKSAQLATSFFDYT